MISDIIGRIKAINSIWTPHAGQISIGKALFNDGMKRIFLQCGRKFGKSEIALYCIVRWALTKPNQECYYIAPFKKQAKRIVWKRLKRIIKQLPSKYIEKVGNDNSLEIHFTNGSTIYVDGSDNEESDRGLEVNFLVYDEFKDFKPEYHLGMEPNLGITDAPLLIIGTPPDHDCQYTEVADECRENKEGNYFWKEAKSEENPHVNRQFLVRKKKELFDRGESSVWMREYEGKYVKGGINAIFPMFNEDAHMMPHKELYYSHILKDFSNMSWYCMTDPGSTSVFGALIVAINKYTKEIFVLDELYEKNSNATSTSIIWPQLEAKMLELNPSISPESDQWYRGYDQAAAWFNNEMWNQFQVSFCKTQKFTTDKLEMISLIKDLFIKNNIIISDRCVNLKEELEKYSTDKNGRISEIWDHLIDCMRYILKADGYSIRPDTPPKQRITTRRAYSLEEDAINGFEDIIYYD